MACFDSSQLAIGASDKTRVSPTTILRPILSPGRIQRAIRALSILVLGIMPSMVHPQTQAFYSNGGNSTPIPGAGHDYVHLLTETTDPSSGSVSISLPFPVPQGRGITWPYVYRYNSSSLYQLAQDQVSSQLQFESYPGPGPATASWSQTTYQYPSSDQPQPPNYVQTFITCVVANAFTFTGIDNVTHNLQLGASATGQTQSHNGSCPSSVTTSSTVNGDGVVNAAFTSGSTTESDLYYWQYSSQSSPVVTNGVVGAFTVSDQSGTTYFFDGGGTTGQVAGPNVWSEGPYKIEDRNGNIISTCPNPTQGYCDTLGNPIAGVTGSTPTSATVKVGGVSYTFANSSTNSSISYSVPYKFLQSSGNTLSCPTTNWNVSGSVPGAVYIQLPNGQEYTLYFGNYNPTDSSVYNPYGLINEIVYPNGGWVKYQWLAPTSSYTQLATYGGANISTGVYQSYGCSYYYATPMVGTRTVSFDGSTVAETQTYQYSTTFPALNGNDWTAKQTSVTTSDKKSGSTYLTVYTYAPGSAGAAPPYSNGGVSGNVPLEQTISYYPTSTATTALATESKGWVDRFHLACDLKTFSNGTTGHFYTYNTTFNQISDDKEYDFGAVTNPSSVCSNSTTGQLTSSPPSSTPARETATTFQSFTNVFKTTFGKPLTVITYGQGTRIAETDYTYDKYSSASPVVSVSATNHDNTNFTSGSPTGASAQRGNATGVTRQCFTSCNQSPTINYTFDQTGQVASKIDPCGSTACADMSGTSHTTTFSYTDNPSNGNSTGNSNAYLTSVVPPSPNGVSLSKGYTYNYVDGNLTSFQDANGQTTSYAYSDSLNRLTGTTYPDGGSTSISYQDSSACMTSSTLMQASPSQSKVDVVCWDGIGQTIQTKLTSDPSGTDYVDTIYNGVGTVASVSNPYRSKSESTYGVTSFTYDALGRKTKQTQQDSSNLQWCYNNTATNSQSNCHANASSKTGTWVDSADEAGNNWQRVTDGLGRLSAVMEPNPTTNALSLETDYTYDALDDLTRVDQWGGAHGASGERARTFTYDNLSRLVSSSNPETGTICYGKVSGSTCSNGYDVNGNLGFKTDARGVVVSYTYDETNRLTHRSYANDATNTPALTFQYDVATGWSFPAQTSPSWPAVTQSNLAGRLSLEYNTPVGTPANTTANSTALALFSYDAMGRVLVKAPCGPHTCGDANGDDIDVQHYAYDLAGNMTFWDRGLDSQRNAAAPNSGYYYRGFHQTYNAAGRLLSITADSGGTNLATNILSNPIYFSAGQLNTSVDLGLYNIARTFTNREWYTTQTTTNTSSGSVWTSTASYNSNSTVKGTTDSYARTWSYTYDDLNRVTTATGPNGAVSYTIDAFGNKSMQTVTSGSGPSGSYGPVASNNQLTGNGMTYDAAGNATYDGFHHYTYDGEGRLYSVDGNSCYTYDPEGDRVAKTNCSGTVQAEYLYDLNHREVTETTTAYTVARANIYAGGDFIAEDSPDPFLTNTATATQMRIVDQVGSLRALMDLGNSKGLWSGAWSSFPYGDGAVAGDGGDSQDQPGGMLFTGKERDAESNNDYFGARYYNSNMGRFLSPDWSNNPSPVPWADLENPQSLNLYAYVNNNPLSRRDPNGHGCDPDTVSTNANGDTVVTAGKCYIDLPLLSVAVGHHFVDQAITKAQGAWNSLAGQFFRRWTTGGPLKNPGVHTGYPKAARLNTQQIQSIVDKYKEISGRDMSQWTKQDIENVVQEVQNAGGDTGKFLADIAEENPTVRTVTADVQDVMAAAQSAYNAAQQAASQIGPALEEGAESVEEACDGGPACIP